MEHRWNDLAVPRPAAAPNLYVEVAHALRTLIVERRLKPGDRLPSERVLAQQLQVGRPVVRDALRILETLGLIGVSPRQGSYVKQPDLAACMEAVVDSVARSRAGEAGWQDDLAEALAILEAEETALAARRATPEEREAVERALDRLRQAAEDPEAFRAAEREFARSVARAAHNPILAGLAFGLAGLCRNGAAPDGDEAVRRRDALRRCEAIAATMAEARPAEPPASLGIPRHGNGQGYASAA